MLWLITIVTAALIALGWRLRTLQGAQTIQFSRDEMLERLDYLYTNGYLANDEYASRRALWLMSGSGKGQ